MVPEDGKATSKKNSFRVLRKMARESEALFSMSINILFKDRSIITKFDKN